MRKSLAVLLLLLSSATARAEWLEASTDHFVIYGETSERNMRRFAEQLERFSAAVSITTGTPRTTPTRSARVNIYVTGGMESLRELYSQDGRRPRDVAGFYIPRIEGPIAFVPELTPGRSRDDLDFSMTVLLHEYAHHVFLSNNRFAAPRWLTEGSAEFFSSAGFASDGSVMLGRPANHRAAELGAGNAVTVTDLLDPDHYEKRRGNRPRYDADFYARAWLFYHFLTFEPGRRPQLNAYIASMQSGRTSREAADAVFGDLAKLDKDLNAYLARDDFKYLKFEPSKLPIGAVTIRTMSRGESAVMRTVMRSKRGAGTEKVREDIRADARATATKFPAEAAVLAALSEAEYDAGDDDAAVAAADAALAIDPGNVNAHIQKGYALFRKARASGDETAMRTARRAFMALNKVENDHPVPLYRFYLSYASGGKEPTANAVEALEQAAGLAPYADEVALALAHRRLVEGRIAEAREALMPIAYDPHGGERAGRLRMFLARLDATGGGDAAAMARALGSLSDEDEKKDDEAGPGSPSDPGAPTGPGAPPGSGDTSKITEQRP